MLHSLAFSPFDSLLITHHVSIPRVMQLSYFNYNVSVHSLYSAKAISFAFIYTDLRPFNSCYTVQLSVLSINITSHTSECSFRFLLLGLAPFQYSLLINTQIKASSPYLEFEHSFQLSLLRLRRQITNLHQASVQGTLLTRDYSLSVFPLEVLSILAALRSLSELPY